MIRRPWRDATVAIALAASWALANGAAAVEVRLRSGRVFSATSAERVGDVVLVQFSGSTLVLPAADVMDIAAEGRSAVPVSVESPSSPGQATADTNFTNIQPGLSQARIRELLVGMPANAELRLALAKALMADGRLTEALSELALVPDDAVPALRVEKALARASVLTHLDRPDEALAALDASPEDPRVAKSREAISRDTTGGTAALASTHFRVHCPEGVDRFDAAPLLAELERAHALIESALGSGPREPILVLLYPGDTFWEATGQGSNVGGLFDGKIRVPAGRVSPPAPRLAEVLRHEVTHAFIHVIAAGRANEWWHEGLAEHFEGDDIGPTLKLLKAAALDGSRWPPAITHEVAHARTEWFLSRYGMSTVADVLRGTARSGEAAALRAATGLSAAELAEAWRVALVEGSR